MEIKNLPNFNEGIFKRSLEKEKERLYRLKEKSKKLNELIVSLDFQVKNVICQSLETSIIPKNEIKFGQENMVYKSGGYKTSYLIDVKLNSNSPINRLNFFGNSIIENDDFIRVLIPKYKTEKFNVSPFQKDKFKDEIFYFDREFNSEEKVIQIELLTPTQKIRRIERSIDYHLYF